MQNQQVISFMEATGVIQYNMTNDYMFRYILQKNKKVLKGLICALLHLRPEQIKKVEIRNPINLNEDIKDKEFVLDIEVLLNDDTQINLEMQVENKHNWTDRSLSYLCRSFDQLYRGQEYDEALPVIHIGFLDYTLFPDAPEFYATNMLMNVKNHRIYNDKFKLSVVDLSKIELATEEDKAFQIDYWARLFKAKTWEELKMLAEKNEYLQEAAQSVYVANADELVRQKCRAREEAERHERTLKRNMEKLREENSTLQEKNSTLQEENSTLQKENSTLQAYVAELEAKLAKR
ncbi:MAG: Rpn family recombination-promoting nuclease/putative transposase [Tyzzerella sp.]|nr:Rpn family recombination-promoting nuclease/putative transposase [Tyzzerella sp.]